MIDDATILKIERIRDDAEGLAKRLRKDYLASSQISKKDVVGDARRIAESWMVDLQGRKDLAEVVGESTWSGIGVQFQRLFSSAERPSPRSSFDAPLTAILKDFRTRVILPLKQRRVAGAVAPTMMVAAQSVSQLKSVFIGHSFTPEDELLVGHLRRLFDAFGVVVRTGKKPRAGSVSEKVQKRIGDSAGFVGVFSRRERLGTKGNVWATSDWVIDEKAYAYGLNKKLILIKEVGVKSIGGIQGDYEYLEFDRDNLLELVMKMIELIMDRD